MYRGSAVLRRHLPAPRRRQVLATDAARFQASRLQHDLSVLLTWQPRWATGRQTDHTLHITFAGHTGEVDVVTCDIVDDRPVTVTASRDDTARTGDLATGNDFTVFDIRDIGCLATGPGGDLIISTAWDLVVLDRCAERRSRWGSSRGRCTFDY